MRPSLPVATIVYLAASTGVRLAAGLVMIKYLSLQFGPSTFGLLTQIMGVAAIFYMFAGGGITNGLIRNIAAATSEDERARWLSAGAAINVISSLALSTIAFLLALFGGDIIFGDPAYAKVYFGIGVAQAVVGFGNLVLAYFSAVGDNRTFALVHAIANILSLFLLIALTERFGLVGAVAGIVIGPAMIGIVSLVFLLSRGKQLRMFQTSWEQPRLKTLVSYSAVMACAVTSVPLAQLLIRSDMSERLGWTAVGYWQAAAKLSDAYMLLVGMIFINYLLPQLARHSDHTRAVRALVRFSAAFLTMFALGCGGLYVMRDHLILLVYSDKFTAARDFMLPQFIGDTIKVAALLAHYYFLSRGRVFLAFGSELLQGISLFFGYVALFPLYGAMAAVYSHVMSYILLLAILVGALRMTQPRANLLIR